jgi:hypothetical protein
VDRETMLRDAAEDALLQESGARRFLYRDVEDLVTTGFLHHGVSMGEHEVVLRTLNPRDLDRLSARTMNAPAALPVLRWTVSSSIWMVDGFEIPLDASQNAAYWIHRYWVRDLHRHHVEVLASTIDGLRRRTSRALRLVEAFCYEPYSRGLWRMEGRKPHKLADQNPVKRIWVAHNLSEDEAKERNTQWAHTRAIVSSLSNKGGKQLAKAVEADEQTEQTRRQRVIEAAVNWVIYGLEDKEEITVKVNGQDVKVGRIHSASTVSDLEEEMRKVVEGETDFHDTMVAQYHKGIRDQTEQKHKAYRQKVDEARARADAAEDRGASPLVGYTKEQLEDLSPGALEARTTARIPESAQTSYMFDRYFKPQLRAGELTPSLKVQDMTQKPGKTPEDEGSLQEKIAKRSPKISEG